MFQFHKVRLKDQYAAHGYSIKVFQFHKVRLKAWWPCSNHPAGI